MSWIWFEGNFVEHTQFIISPSDRGLCHGLSVFETLLALDSNPCQLSEHLWRLDKGLARMGCSWRSYKENELRALINELCKRNGYEKGSARIRITVSLGNGSLNQVENSNVWAWMTAYPVTEPTDELRVTKASWKKDQGSVLVGLKTGNYAESLLALDQARRAGFDEVIFTNQRDEICEAAMANVFLIQNEVLSTPYLESGCLAGVTRDWVINYARANGIHCEEKAIFEMSLNSADGVFLTSSILGPRLISSLGEKKLTPSPLFAVIRNAWLRAMREEKF